MLLISCLEKNHNQLLERANLEKRSVIYEFDNSMILIQTKHIYMHISECRSVTKITHYRVSTEYAVK